MSTPTLPESTPDLDLRMTALGVQEADLEETFVRSGGAGGQKVNKSSSCVMILHKPTGLRVKCQTSRQQGMNRVLARRILLDKLEERQRARAAAAKSEQEKIRRQKRKRSKGAKERMLADKAHRGEKKRARGAVRGDSD
jgi:protein subunit release factor B